MFLIQVEENISTRIIIDGFSGESVHFLFNFMLHFLRGFLTARRPQVDFFTFNRQSIPR